MIPLGYLLGWKELYHNDMKRGRVFSFVSILSPARHWGLLIFRPLTFIFYAKYVIKLRFNFYDIAKVSDISLKQFKE